MSDTDLAYDATPSLNVLRRAVLAYERMVPYAIAMHSLHKHIQETTKIAVQFVPVMRFLVLDFAVWSGTERAYAATTGLGADAAGCE
eukprot:1344250-Rhodomonas_salina.2